MLPSQWVGFMLFKYISSGLFLLLSLTLTAFKGCLRLVQHISLFELWAGHEEKDHQTRNILGLMLDIPRYFQRLLEIP